MTTGRINQVTILRRPTTGVEGRQTPRKGQSSQQEGSAPKHSPARRDSHQSPKARTAAAHRTIQLPPLSSPKDGPPKTRSHPPKGAATGLSIRLSGGGYLPPVTPEGGYRHGLTPDCLAGMLANGHQPTDSIRAGRSESPTGLQVPLEQRAPALGAEACSAGRPPPKDAMGQQRLIPPHRKRGIANKGRKAGAVRRWPGSIPQAAAGE